jgi:hypothetical protein
VVNVYGVRFAGFCFGFVPHGLGLMLGGYSSAWEVMVVLVMVCCVWVGVCN